MPALFQWVAAVGPWASGSRAREAGEQGKSRFDWVGPEFFKTLGVPILAGRAFDDRDSANSPAVAIVNETFARRLLGGVNPIGKTFRSVAEPNYPETVYQIVGLVKDTKYQNLRESQQAICFAPSSQYPLGGGPFAQILVHSSMPVASLTAAVKSAIGEISPDIFIYFQVFKTMIRDGLVEDRAMAMLSGFFGFLATLLAMIGLYGVMSYMVARRRSEIGIRMALGAKGPRRFENDPA